MKRRWFAVVGVLLLAFDVTLASRAAPTVAAMATVALIGVGGTLLILGGLELGGEAVPWHALVGVAELVFGAVFVVAWVPPALRGDPTTTELVMAAAGAIGGIALGRIGLDWLHGDGWFDPSAYEPGPLLGGGAEDEADGPDEPGR